MTTSDLRQQLCASVDLIDIGGAIASAGSAVRIVGLGIMGLHELPPERVLEELTNVSDDLASLVRALTDAAREAR